MLQVPARIAEAAKRRIDSTEAKKMQRKVDSALERNKPAEAEPDTNRRLLRVQAVANVDASDARRLLGGENPSKVLKKGDGLYGAERLIGDTVDFLPVSFLTVGKYKASAVARVIYRNGKPVGSGFLISDKLFLTNNHVIGSPSDTDEMYLEFDYETEPLTGKAAVTTRFVLAPNQFFETSDKDDYDFTVICVGNRVDGPKNLADYGYCTLSDRGDKHMLGEFVNLIQHPEGDFKQVVLRENKLVSRLDTVLHYEADTQPGSSGSPVFNDEWEAVALHHWGGPHRESSNKPGFVNEGIRISAIVKELMTRQPGMKPEHLALIENALKPSKAISLDASPTQPISGDAVGDSESKPAPDPNFSNRTGYDAKFLKGFTVPLPKVTGNAPGTLAKLLHPKTGSDPSELKYEHFSTLMNKKRQFPFVTAANIDGKLSKKVDRKSGRVSARNVDDDESAEASETWYTDGRIANEDQTDQSLYSNQKPRVFDRGHQVRREDPVWGDKGSAERANADTFHFTNCCPQEYRFNEQQKFWAGIENYVLDNARTEQAKVSVFTGPVFASTDPLYRKIRVPLQFYKIIARIENGELKSTAFLADQSELLRALPERLGNAESFDDVGKVREYLTTVAEVEELTGLDFGILRDHDTNGGEALGSRLPLNEASLRKALGLSEESSRSLLRKAESLSGFAPAFSQASLSNDTFDWQTVLSTALASQLVYSDEATVKSTAISQWGFKTCQFFDINNTRAFVASTDDTTFVVFRGTDNVNNWLSNLEVVSKHRPYGWVHLGFFNAFMQVQTQLIQTIQQLGKKRIVTTGHSLGGALATIFAAEYGDTLPIRLIQTYGQPRVGIGSDFTKALNGRFGMRFIRFVNEDDIVPRVPPLFVHVGKLIHFNAKGSIDDSAEALTTSEDLPALTEREFEQLKAQIRSGNDLAATGAEGLIPSVSDHAIAKYIAKITAQMP